MNLIERLNAAIPAEYQYQKAKCKDSKEENEIKVDWVVQTPESIPAAQRKISLLKIKGPISIASLRQTPLRVDGLIIHKKFEITKRQLISLKKAWHVKQVFDFRNKARKPITRARIQAFQDKHPGDMNKVVINPESSLDKKAKVAFSDSFITDVLSMVEKKEKPLDNISSMKFAVDFETKHKDVFDQLLPLCERFSVVTKKSTMSEEQKNADLHIREAHQKLAAVPAPAVETKAV